MYPVVNGSVPAGRHLQASKQPSHLMEQSRTAMRHPSASRRPSFCRPAERLTDIHMAVSHWLSSQEKRKSRPP